EGGKHLVRDGRRGGHGFRSFHGDDRLRGRGRGRADQYGRDRRRPGAVVQSAEALGPAPLAELFSQRVAAPEPGRGCGGGGGRGGGGGGGGGSPWGKRVPACPAGGWAGGGGRGAGGEGGKGGGGGGGGGRGGGRLRDGRGQGHVDREGQRDAAGLGQQGVGRD